MAETDHPIRIERRHSVVLALLGAVAVVLFILTSFAVRFYHGKEGALALGWFEQGQAALSAGQANDAVADFRNALAYSSKTMYQLRLAQALIAAGRHDEARAYLLTLWERQPGNSLINLLLARRAADQGAVAQAADYYHNAIYGIWEDQDPQLARRNTRFELAEFLLKHGERQAADSDLVALAANLPADAGLHTRVATLLSQAGDLPRSMEEYRRALAIDPHYGPALAEAGEIAYAQGDYSAARDYLRRALQAEPQNAQAKQVLETSESVLRMDPLAPRLSTAERARRAAAAFAQALARVRDCAAKVGLDLTAVPATSELQSVYDRAQAWQPLGERVLRRDPDRIYTVTDWVAAAEAAATKTCGAPSGPDLALALIGKQPR